MLSAKIGYFRPRGFDPRSISGLAVWLDATDAATLFQDSAATTPATAGQPVGAWRSKATPGGAFTQTTNSLRPTLTASYQNGRQSVVSDGSTTWLSAASSSIGIGSLSSASGFFVYRRTGGGNAAWDFGTSASTNINVGNTSIFDDTFRTTRTPGSFTGVNVGISTVTAPTSSGARGYRVNGAQMPFTDSQFFAVPATVYVGGGPAFPSGFNVFGGGICEVLVFDRAVSSAEISTIETYLSGKWGIALAPTASNADAQSWINRVYANGGTVSATTANAVNDFCNAIDAAGIRDRFFRLNLFCGTGLAAALVPLYRGQSLGGTQFGNATDTNVNFAAGDYVETGSTGGLKGNGSNKHLLTGFLPSDTGAGLHMAVALQSDINLNSFAIGCDNAFDAGWTACNMDFPSAAPPGGGTSALRARCALSSNAGSVSQSALTASSAFRFLCSSPRTTGSAQVMYENGVQTQSLAPTYQTHPAFGLAVFGGNRKGTVVARTTARLSSYSAGLDMTGTQAAAYNSALVAFLTALGRNV